MCPVLITKERVQASNGLKLRSEKIFSSFLEKFHFSVSGEVFSWKQGRANNFNCLCVCLILTDLQFSVWSEHFLFPLVIFRFSGECTECLMFPISFLNILESSSSNDTILFNKSITIWWETNYTECQHLWDYSKQKQCHRSFPPRLIGLVIPLDFPTEEYNSSDHFVYFARVFISPVWGEESSELRHNFSYSTWTRANYH